MKIKAPLTDKKEVEKLCEAGADEFFCGIESSGWKKKYKGFAISQRAGGANFSKLEELEKAIDIAHRHHAKVHVAINAFFYREEQYSDAIDLIKDILDIGADGIIFADLGLLLNIDKRLLRGKDIVIGVDAVIFNSAAVHFYRSFGASRVVLPRSMTLSEMGEVVEKEKGMEYEVFIIHDLCFFEDGLCTYCKEASGQTKKRGKLKDDVHFFSNSRPLIRGYGGGCRTRFSRTMRSLKNKRQIGRVKNFTFWDKKHIQGCGACALSDFKKIGINSLKILDRNLPTGEKIKAVKFIKEAKDLLDDGCTKGEFTAKCKELFRRTFKVRCSMYDCYYPLNC